MSNVRKRKKRRKILYFPSSRWEIGEKKVYVGNEKLHRPFLYKAIFLSLWYNRTKEKYKKRNKKRCEGRIENESKRNNGIYRSYARDGKCLWS